MNRVRQSAVVYGLMAVLIILSLVILFRLRSQFEETLEARIADLQRVFSNSKLLKTSSNYKISFADIESEALKYENRGDFGTIRIAKRFGNVDHVVYPFYYPAIVEAGLPLPGEESVHEHSGYFEEILNDIQRVELPLESDNERLGTLYVDVDYGALRVVTFVIWTLGAMLAASLAFFASQFRSQEKVISATTIELEQKRRELVRLERLALAGQLSANILHDLKKPVLNIRNEAYEMLHPVTDSSVDSPGIVFERVREQADFFLSVLRDGGFDRFVRAQEEREYVDINNLLDRSLALVRYEQGSVVISKNYAENLPAVLAEPVRLIQVFSNLVLNACQAMDGRGNLSIVSREENGNLNVVLTDSGPGIPAGHLNHIFEPFYTTKAAGQGTGLGLYIVQDILRDLGGNIIVDSQPGKTQFTITLPIAG